MAITGPDDTRQKRCRSPARLAPVLKNLSFSAGVPGSGRETARLFRVRVDIQREQSLAILSVSLTESDLDRDGNPKGPERDYRMLLLRPQTCPRALLRVGLRFK